MVLFQGYSPEFNDSHDKSTNNSVQQKPTLYKLQGKFTAHLGPESMLGTNYLQNTAIKTDYGRSSITSEI